jgi:hypothetical protein
VQQRWNELRTGVLKTSVINQYVDSVASVLNQESQQRNFARWPVLGTYTWPNYYYVNETFDSNIVWLKNWITKRMNWLDDRIGSMITEVEGSIDDLQISLSPNPFTNIAHLTYTLSEPGKVTIELFDSVGRAVVTSEVRHAVGGTFVKALPGNFEPGLYLLKVSVGKKQSIMRVVRK